jgi:hypothetical protein
LCYAASPYLKKKKKKKKKEEKDNYLYHRNRWVEFITLCFVFTTASPDGIGLEEKKYTSVNKKVRLQQE